MGEQQPTSSALPPGFAQRPAPPTTPHHDPRSAFTLPKLRLEIRDLSHAGALRTLAAINFAECAAACARDVLALLYVHPDESTTNVPGTRSVTFVIRDMGGVAYTTGIDLDRDHKEIHFSAPYIAGIPQERLREELCGVITHELVHCFQHDACQTCPGGLIEGVADWVRLRCGHVPPHWKREAKGHKWDAGYQTTGYFLEYLEQQCGEGTVRRLNEKLRLERYDQDKFWTELLGISVEDLWAAYGASLD